MNSTTATIAAVTIQRFGPNHLPIETSPSAGNTHTAGIAPILREKSGAPLLNRVGVNITTSQMTQKTYLSRGASALFPVRGRAGGSVVRETTQGSPLQNRRKAITTIPVAKQVAARGPQTGRPEKL